jgi:biopolymer transport protein ExbD
MITEEERQKMRKKRQRARKRKRVRKKILLIIAAIIILLAVFIVTVKLVNPDFDIASYLPSGKAQQAVEMIDSKLFNKTTTTSTTLPTTQNETTTKARDIKKADYDYDDFSVFAFDTSLQGNQVGNLLNKSNGAVTYSSSYIYYSIEGKGIFRFEPNEEKNAKIVSGNYNFKYLNVLGDYLYAVDVNTSTLKKFSVSGGDGVNISDNIAFAYLYNDKIYFVGTDNTVGFINLSDNNKTVLYAAPADKTVSFAGISLSRVFFVTHDSVANYDEYITVNLSDSNDVLNFRDDTKNNEIVNLSFECGFMYYYKKNDDSTYSLCRQKFGSDNVVTLVDNCSVTDYPVVYSNRLYFGELDGSKYKARELNMNSKATKTMLSVSDCDGTGTLAVGYGYQYVFLIGTKSDGGEFTCKTSCIYTSSSSDNTLSFNGKKLTY